MNVSYIHNMNFIQFIEIILQLVIKMKKSFTLYLHVNLPLLMNLWSIPLSLPKFEFRKWITSLHIQHSIYVRKFDFFPFYYEKIYFYIL